jgi:hypothetical protein
MAEPVLDRRVLLVDPDSGMQSGYPGARSVNPIEAPPRRPGTRLRIIVAGLCHRQT